MAIAVDLERKATKQTKGRERVGMKIMRKKNQEKKVVILNVKH